FEGAKQLQASHPDDREQAALHRFADRALVEYRNALSKAQTTRGLAAIQAFTVCRRAQRVVVEGEDLGRMGSDLGAWEISKVAGAVIAGAVENQTPSIQTISARLRTRRRLGVTLSLDTLQLAARAWEIFSREDGERTAALRNGVAPASLAEAERDEFRYVDKL